jgi:hypothetical protein
MLLMSLFIALRIISIQVPISTLVQLRLIHFLNPQRNLVDGQARAFELIGHGICTKSHKSRCIMRHTRVNTNLYTAIALFRGGLFIFLISCSDPVACDPCTSDAIIYGRVTNGGEALPHAPLRFSVYEGNCGEGFRGGGPTFTDEVGNYRLVIASLFSPFTARCIIASVNPEGTPGIPSAAFNSVQNLRFRFDPRREALDSIRLDIQSE